MKIVLDARWIFPEITGIGSYTRELIQQLARLDRHNDYVLLFASEELRTRTAAETDWDAAPNFSAQVLPYGLFSVTNQWQLPRWLRTQKADLYHSPNFMIPLTAFPRHRRGRTAAVVTIHDLIPLRFPEWTPRALKSRFHPLYRGIMREVAARADHIITVSQTSRNDILECLLPTTAAASRVTAIYNGVNANFAPPAAPPATATPPTILYVGRMDPYKNVPDLIRIFSELVNQDGLDARLRLIGPRDPRYPQVEATIAATGIGDRVDWPGYVSGDELRQAYQQATVFVMPSLYEGFGLPVLEAMACGTPVVCSNRASLPEVAGNAAWLLDPTDHTGWRQALKTLCTQPDQAAQWRAKGLARAAEFTWTRTAEQTIQVYHELG